MATSAPPLLPLTTPQTTPATISTTTTNAQSSDPPVASPAFRAFLTRIHDQVKDGLSQRRPWSELVDRSAFSKPESLSDSTSRLRKNSSYFRVNYLAFLSLVLAFSLLTHPFSLLTLTFLFAAWSFFYLFKPADRPVILFGRTFSDRETLGSLLILTVFLVFLTNVGSLLISALVIGSACVAAHAVFRVPEDLFLDDQDSAGESTGFLSFLGAATKTASTSVARV
ncbi:PRA1 family protein B4 [Bienertia sinuspersici]